MDVVSLNYRNSPIINIMFGENSKPNFFHLFQTDQSLTKKDYQNYAKSIIEEFKNQGGKVISFCTDGLKHQVNTIHSIQIQQNITFMNKR
jgi:hypothetical protein